LINKPSYFDTRSPRLCKEGAEFSLYSRQGGKTLWGFFHISYSSLASHLALTFADKPIDGGSGKWQTYLEKPDIALSSDF
jgi:hypothetical protein